MRKKKTSSRAGRMAASAKAAAPRLTPAKQAKADWARFKALVEKYWQPPRPMSEREIEAWRRQGGLADPGPAAGEPHLPDGTPNRRFRVATLLCHLVCQRDHCRREGRCVHTIVPALRENMHWLLRVYCEYTGQPINHRVIAAERVAGIEHADAKRIMRKHPKRDPFAEIGGDAIAPMAMRKAE